MSNTELAVRSSSDIESLDDFDKILTGQLEPPEIVDDPDEISRQIIMQILNSETEAETENFGTATGWRDLEGVPVKIQGFRWRASSFDEGGPIYVLVNGFRLDTGEAVVLTTGSANVLAQLSWLARNGRLPGAVKELKKAAKATASGYWPLALSTPEGHEPEPAANDEA